MSQFSYYLNFCRLSSFKIYMLKKLLKTLLPVVIHPLLLFYWAMSSLRAQQMAT